MGNIRQLTLILSTDGFSLRSDFRLQVQQKQKSNLILLGALN